MKPIKNVNASDNYAEKDYQELLHDTIAVIESSRVQIAKQINTSIMSSHWEIGKLLEERKLDSKHGDQIVKRLSVDLKAKYPNMGLSPRNLWNMKRFYLRYYQEDTKVQRSVALLPWRHNMLLLRHNLSTEHIVFYANEIINKGWSFDILNLALKSEYVGKMNFYLSLLDKLEKAPEENPSIGIILCAGKDHLEVELALQDINKPIGVAEFQYLIPKNKLEEMIKNEIKKRDNNLGIKDLRN